MWDTLKRRWTGLGRGFEFESPPFSFEEAESIARVTLRERLKWSFWLSSKFENPW
jgi:hypothetical protein